MTKIDLITGILGAGKTTFLLKYARHLIDSGQRIAILENDFGAVNADMALLQELKGENCQLEMISGGCDAHCHRRRFRTQLIALGMQHFDRVLIEPSGIYDMDEFFDILHEPPVDSWFEIGSILTILNAETEALLTDEMEYLLASEAACAGKLLLSKLPDKNPEQRASEILKHLNQALSDIQCDRSFTETDLFCKDWSKLDAADFEILANAGYRNASYIKKYQTDMLRSTVHYFLHIHLPESEIEPVIREIMEDSECGTIYRIKGTLPAADGTFLSVNAEKNRITLSPTVIGQAVLIVIGETLNREQIDTHLKAKNTDPEYVSI
ncbi:MAG: GTPase (G3E family) [Oscillospiraceae bacterium]|nr:GTPase (G3E family) [Oscillospiraceae bacterium]